MVVIRGRERPAPAGHRPLRAAIWLWTCGGLYPFWAYCRPLLHCHNLILQCSNSIPTLGVPPSRGLNSGRVNVSNLARKPCDPGARRRAPRRAGPRRAGTGRGKGARKPINLGAAGRRRARRLHLGRARPAARRRPARDRGYLRRLGGRGERGHAGRRARARRSRRGAPAARRFLARGERRRPPARPAARRGRAAVPVRPARRPVVRRDVADAVALRSQPAQHQSAQGR